MSDAPAIHLNTPLHASPAHDGQGYDRCPRDGCGVYDAAYVQGGKSPRGEEHYGWSVYSADPHQGGCGASWSRTGATRHQVNQARGMPTQYGTRSVQRAAAVSIPSEAFKRNWEQIDWSK